MTRATAPQFWGPCGAHSTKHTSPSAACESKTSSFQGGATKRGEDAAVSEEAPREPRARTCLLAGEPPPPPGVDAGRAETPRVRVALGPTDASARVASRRGATRARANSELVNRSAIAASPGARRSVDARSDKSSSAPKACAFSRAACRPFPDVSRAVVSNEDDRLHLATS
jgi:hypothetical protein